MSKLLYFGGNGTSDPTKAAFPFIGAKGALDAGIECSIALFGDAVVLMKDVIAENVHPVGWPPLKGVMEEVIKSGKVPIYV